MKHTNITWCCWALWNKKAEWGCGKCSANEIITIVSVYFANISILFFLQDVWCNEIPRVLHWVVQLVKQVVISNLLYDKGVYMVSCTIKVNIQIYSQNIHVHIVSRKRLLYFTCLRPICWILNKQKVCSLYKASS